MCTVSVHCVHQANQFVMTSYISSLFNPIKTISEVPSYNDILLSINNKIDDISLRLSNIEHRLETFDSTVNKELSDIKSSASSLLLEVRENAQPVTPLSDMSISDSVSQTSSQTCDSGVHSTSVHESHLSDSKVAVLLSDSDMPDLATKTGHLLNCKVDMVNYSEGLSDPSLFQREIQFVLVQCSDQVVNKYSESEVTNEIIEELTAHVQTLVRVAINILEMQPNTKVFFGSLPPRYDGRVSRELTRIYNGLLLTESFMVDSITVIDQSQLHTNNEYKMYERYKEDLVTLTRYGNKLKARNIAHQIAQAVSGLKVVRPCTAHTREQKNHQLRHDQWGGRRRSYLHRW